MADGSRAALTKLTADCRALCGLLSRRDALAEKTAQTALDLAARIRIASPPFCEKLAARTATDSEAAAAWTHQEAKRLIGSDPNATPAQRVRAEGRAVATALQGLLPAMEAGDTPDVAEAEALSDNEYTILRALRDAHPKRLLMTTLEANTGISRRTCSALVRILAQRGLADYDESKREGSAITPEGRELLAQERAPANFPLTSP